MDGSATTVWCHEGLDVLQRQCSVRGFPGVGCYQNGREGTTKGTISEVRLGCLGWPIAFMALALLFGLMLCSGAWVASGLCALLSVGLCIEAVLRIGGPEPHGSMPVW